MEGSSCDTWIRMKHSVRFKASIKRCHYLPVRPHSFVVNEGKVIFRNRNRQGWIFIKFGFEFSTNNRTGLQLPLYGHLNAARKDFWGEMWNKESLILENDQLGENLLYFTIYLLHSSTCFERYMLIIRRMNCIDLASGIVLPVSGRPVYRLGKNWLEWAHSNQFSPNLCTGRPLTKSTIPDAASIYFILLMMSI